MQRMIIIRYLFIVLLVSPLMSFAQRTKTLTTNSKGTLFGYFGYNRTTYTDGNLKLSANGYDLTLGNVSFADNDNYEGLKNYFSAKGVENFQFNAHIGYYFWHKWAITAGVDHYTIFMNPEQRVTVDGTIAQGEHGNLVGNYNDFVLNMTPNHFAYSQTNGFHIVRLGVQNTQQWYQTSKNQFALQTNVGGGLGLVVSNSDYTFGNFTHRGASSVSGLAALGNASIRMVFIQHIFLQTGISGGFINQRNIQLNNIGSDVGSHRNGFLSPEISLGVSLFLRPTDGCGTCPQW